MEVGDRNGVLDRDAGPLVGSFSVHAPSLHATSEEHHRGAGGEMAVLAVVGRQLQEVFRRTRLILGIRAGLTLRDHVAAELAGDHHERAIEQAAFLEIADEGRDGAVDLGVQSRHPFVAVLVRVPVDEGNVFRGHLDVAGPVLDEPPREQAATAEAAGVVPLLNFLRLARDVEGLSLLGTEQPVGIVDAAEH